jgi:hypothetical protein
VRGVFAAPIEGQAQLPYLEIPCRERLFSVLSVLAIREKGALRIPHAYVHAEADSQTKGLVALPTAEGVWDKLPDATDDVSREEQRLQR